MPDKRHLPDPDDLDLTHYAAFLAEDVETRVRTALADGGYADLRRSHGYVFQVLLPGARTVGEVATALDISPQGASKVLGELEGLGYVERVRSSDDARRRVVAMTDRAHAAVALARASRAATVTRLRRSLGRDRIDDATATVRAALESLGVMERVRARRLPLRED